jgi:hypothetical protein
VWQVEEAPEEEPLLVSVAPETEPATVERVEEERDRQRVGRE